MLTTVASIFLTLTPAPLVAQPQQGAPTAQPRAASTVTVAPDLVD